jgi:hypothetical protein
VLDVYETGQYAIETPDKPLIGSIAKGFFGGSSPWVYEVIYINRSKLLVRNSGIATSAEMAEVSYVVDYYIHIDSKQEALDLITHMPFSGTVIDTAEVADYAGPAIEQAINQIVQVTKLENINEHINDVREAVKVHLADFLKVYGIMLNDLKVLIMPRDDRMRELISLRRSASPDQIGALLSSAQDGGKGSGLRAQCGGGRAVRDRWTAHRVLPAWPGSGRHHERAGRGRARAERAERGRAGCARGASRAQPVPGLWLYVLSRRKRLARG